MKQGRIKWQCSREVKTTNGVHYEEGVVLNQRTRNSTPNPSLTIAVRIANANHCNTHFQSNVASTTDTVFAPVSEQVNLKSHPTGLVLAFDSLSEDVEGIGHSGTLTTRGWHFFLQGTN